MATHTARNALHLLNMLHLHVQQGQLKNCVYLLPGTRCCKDFGTDVLHLLLLLQGPRPPRTKRLMSRQKHLGRWKLPAHTAVWVAEPCLSTA